jgi:predicted dehydrogenase
MNEKKIRIGLIGAGFVGHIHARAYARVADLGAELVAVAAVPLDQAETLAREFGIPGVYEDYHEVLRREEIDIVDICVPNHLHERFTLEAIGAGKHVICEKPLTGYFGGQGASDHVGETPKKTMLEEAVRSADRMLVAAGRRGVQLMYAENWLYSPAIQKARRLIETGRGTILEIRAQECHSGSHASYAKSWKYAGGGALVRLGPHPLGCAMYLKWREGMERDGNPIRVHSVMAETGNLARIPSFERESEKWLVTDWDDVENWATLLLTFSDGSRAIISAADTVLGGMEDSLEVFMSNGRVKCDMTHSTMMQAYAPDPRIFAGEYIAEKLETKAGWSNPSIDEEWLLGYPQEIRDFVEAIGQNRSPVSTAELGREVVKVTYAAYQSAEEGRRIILEQA